MSITLTMTNDKDNHNIVLKLLRQFTHPSQEKLLQPIKMQENHGVVIKI